jgi:HK97 family phage major capsid protein
MKTRIHPHALPLLLLGLVAFAAILAGMSGAIDPSISSMLLLAEGAAVVDPELIKKELGRIGDLVKEEAKKALDMAEKGVKLSEDQKKQIDDLLLKSNELKSRLETIEQANAKKGTDDGDNGGGESVKTALEKSAEKIKEFAETRGLQKRVDIPVSRKALTNTGATGAALNYPGTQILQTPLQPLLRRLRIRDLLMPGRISGAVAFYPRESGYTNNAAPVSEGSLKPKSTLTFELITEPVRTLAHLFDVSLQMLADIAYLESYIGARGMRGLKDVEDTQLLTGSGTGQNLEGVYTAATAYAAPSGATINGAAPGGAGETDIDKLRLALLQVELADAGVSGMVLHPTDWASIELLKDTQARYLFVNPANYTMPMLWGVPVVSTRGMTQGRFLVGDFAAHAQILDREDANIAISFENKDNFERNMATIRVEERLALAIYRPEAFVKGVLESAS